MHSEIGFEIRLDLTYDEAISRTVEALKVEGFGVLTKIHMRTTMREKLNV